jgi:NAD(P)-dependent dehydrogenase (short-subunit alcohol dehydrogenase family)
VVVTSRNAERVARTAKEIGGAARGVPADLSNEAETKALFEKVGQFDHLVYTAGDELLLSPIGALDLAAARRAFEVRVFGALAALKHGAARIEKGGSIVLTHGIAGVRPQGGWAVGASVCGAMESMTRALAVELAPIRVNAVSPGFVRTPLWNPIPEASREALFEDVGKKLLTRKVGEAREIAEAYCYLMQNTFTTGQTLVADGGGTLV